MASVTFTIPNAFATRLNDAIAAKHGYDATIHGTKADFAKAIIVAHMKQVVLEYESQIAAGSARATVETDINSVSIT